MVAIDNFKATKRELVEKGLLEEVNGEFKLTPMGISLPLNQLMIVLAEPVKKRRGRKPKCPPALGQAPSAAVEPSHGRETISSQKSAKHSCPSI